MSTILKQVAMLGLAVVFLMLLSNGAVQAQEAATVQASSHAEFGDILTDAGGNTLYLFTLDERNKSNCSGGCAGAWPPLVTAGDPAAGDGVAGSLGTLDRDDGST